MNLESARNRVKIIEGLAKRIDRCCDASVLDSVSLIVVTTETILKQCAALEFDLRETLPVKDHNGALGAHRVE